MIGTAMLKLRLYIKDAKPSVIPIEVQYVMDLVLLSILSFLSVIIVVNF